MKNKHVIAVISAMQKELDAVLNIIGQCQEVIIGPRKIYIGSYQGNKVILSVAGIGKVNAAITTTIICSEFHPDLIINCGVAGGVDKTLHTLDIVIADNAIYHDVDSGFLEANMHFGQIQGEPAFFPCNKSVVDLLKKQGDLPFKYQVGTIITGDQFVTDRSYIDKVLNAGFTDCHVVACDMESASIAQVAYQFKIPVTIVRSISDVVGVKQESDYPNFVLDACKNASYIISLILNK